VKALLLKLLSKLSPPQWPGKLDEGGLRSVVFNAERDAARNKHPNPALWFGVIKRGRLPKR
jgi:hypothetical protein